MPGVPRRGRRPTLEADAPALYFRKTTRRASVDAVVPLIAGALAETDFRITRGVASYVRQLSRRHVALPELAPAEAWVLDAMRRLRATPEAVAALPVLRLEGIDRYIDTGTFACSTPEQAVGALDVSALSARSRAVPVDQLGDWLMRYVRSCRGGLDVGRWAFAECAFVMLSSEGEELTPSALALLAVTSGIDRLDECNLSDVTKRWGDALRHGRRRALNTRAIWAKAFSAQTVAPLRAVALSLEIDARVGLPLIGPAVGTDTEPAIHADSEKASSG